MSDPYVTVAGGRDLFGKRWEVGVRGPGVVIEVPGGTLHLDDDDPDDGPLLAPFAEAVARARQLADAARR